MHPAPNTLISETVQFPPQQHEPSEVSKASALLLQQHDDASALVEQKVDAKTIREQLNTIYVKHALLVAKKMHDEGDCISDDGITIVF